MTKAEYKRWEKTLDKHDKNLSGEYHDALLQVLKEVNENLLTNLDTNDRTRLIQIRNQIQESLDNAFTKVDITQESDGIMKDTLVLLGLFGLAKLGWTAIQKARVKSTNSTNANLGKSLHQMEGETKTAMYRRLQGIAAQGIVQQKSVDEISKELKLAMTSLEKRHINTIVRTANSEIQNRALLEKFDKDPKVIGYMSMSVMDTRTTEVCSNLFGRMFLKANGWNRDKLQSSKYAIPRHYNCRSHWEPLLQPPTDTINVNIPVDIKDINE